MKYLQHLGLLCMVVIVGIACAGSNSTLQPEVQKPANAVGIVNGGYVTYDELKENFISGSINNDYTDEELLEFLPIYLDYKGKLLNAKDAGYFESDYIRQEYEVYAKQASYAYWMDQEIRPTKFNQFKERFDYEINISDEINLFELEVPPLLVQPYVENAIIHGLVEPIDNGMLKILYKRENDHLKVIVLDNGIGIFESKRRKSKEEVKRRPRGMSITRRRLELLEGQVDRNNNVVVEEVKDETGVVLGTKVTLKVRLE